MEPRAGKGITVILRAGSDNHGFSLLELLLVLLLLGLSSLIVLPTIDNGLRERAVRRSALSLAAVARELRSRAIYEGIPQRLVLNVVDSSYLIARDREVHLPSDVKFSRLRAARPSRRAYGNLFSSRTGAASEERSACRVAEMQPRIRCDSNR